MENPMETCLKLIAAAFLIAPLAALEVSPVAAQAVSAEPSAVDVLCDNCKDYTDAGTSAGTQRSAYRPGIGYAAEPENEAAAAQPRPQDVARLRFRQRSPATETK
jgi:hypothetical protein